MDFIQINQPILKEPIVKIFGRSIKLSTLVLGSLITAGTAIALIPEDTEEKQDSKND